MTYKGFDAVVEFDEEDGLFTGNVVNIRDVIHFQSATREGLVAEFHASVDEYLDFAGERTAGSVPPAKKKAAKKKSK